jgi:hypothetical protein
MYDKPLDLDTTMTFGQYEGDAVEDVIDKDAQYITWCIDTMNDFELDDEAYAYYQKVLEEG